MSLNLVTRWKTEAKRLQDLSESHANIGECHRSDICLARANELSSCAIQLEATAPNGKRDQLDTQRHGKEVDGDRIREFKSWLAGGMRGYANICFRVDKLVYDERADSAAAGPPATLTLEQILNVLYKGRTMVNFNHVPSVTRAIDWLSMDFRRVIEELPATAATPTEPPKEQGGA